MLHRTREMTNRIAQQSNAVCFVLNNYQACVGLRASPLECPCVRTSCVPSMCGLLYPHCLSSSAYGHQERPGAASSFEEDHFLRDGPLPSTRTNFLRGGPSARNSERFISAGRDAVLHLSLRPSNSTRLVRRVAHVCPSKCSMPDGLCCS